VVATTPCGWRSPTRRRDDDVDALVDALREWFADLEDSPGPLADGHYA